MIPPLAILPILFIVLGLGEVAKIALIVIGVAPVHRSRPRAARRRAAARAAHQGADAGRFDVAAHRCAWSCRRSGRGSIDALRLTLGSAWLFLIAAEAIASTEGLGYRIFLVRRYLAMDVILPYVVWITAARVRDGLAAADRARAPVPVGRDGALTMAHVTVQRVCGRSTAIRSCWRT